jgi:hypothetical protein
MATNITELEKDCAELQKFIGLSERQNIKRNLENHMKTITGLIESERKLVEKTNTVVTETKPKEDDKYKYTTITNYGFESSEKFAK